MRGCLKHGLSDRDKTGRCRKCSIEVVDRSRRKKKMTLLQEHGGECRICGYNRSFRALQFHHLDPATKLFDISDKGRSYSLERLRVEAAKCVLVCANCHMELEDGIVTYLAD